MKIFEELGMSLDIGRHVTCGQVHLAPVVAKGSLVSETVATLDELLEKDLVHVSENEDGADVQEVLLVNRSEHFLVVFDNDIIKGAMQNRVSQSTVVVAPREKCNIPVLCVEAGRWSYGGEKEFRRSDLALGPRMRGRRMDLSMSKASVHETQSMIWGEVNMLSEKLGTTSETSDLTTVLEKRSFREEKMLRNFVGKSNAHGFCVVAGRHRFLELYWDQDVCRRQSLKAVRSWIADATKEDTPRTLLDDDMRKAVAEGDWMPVAATGVESACETKGKRKGRTTLLGAGFLHSFLEY